MANSYILSHRAEWDRQHARHDVVFSRCGVSGEWEIVLIVPDDNSLMGSDGPMLTPEAEVALESLGYEGFDAIDHNIYDGWGI